MIRALPERNPGDARRMRTTVLLVASLIGCSASTHVQTTALGGAVVVGSEVWFTEARRVTTSVEGRAAGEHDVLYIVRCRPGARGTAPVCVRDPVEESGTWPQ